MMNDRRNEKEYSKIWPPNSFHVDIEAKLRTAWTQALYKEYEQICYTYRLKLVTPLIAIEDVDTSWGSWNLETRKIVISFSLVRQYSWGQVVLILKHEMAHQIVDEVFKIREQHGPWFKKAAELLGIDSFASISDLDLKKYNLNSLRPELSPEDVRLLNRVEKLLSLANSSNEHEALSAMRKVRELYHNFDLEHINLLNKREYVCYTVTTGKKRLPRHYNLLALLLSEHFQVRVIFSHEYDARKLDTFKTLEILGASHHVNIAEYVFSFLLHRLESEWQQHIQFQSEKTPGAKADFFYGVIHGFKQKLSKLGSATATAGAVPHQVQQTAIIKQIIDHEADKYVKFKYPRLRMASFTTKTTHAAAFQEGVRRGQSINLNKALTHKRKTSPTFLPSSDR